MSELKATIQATGQLSGKVNAGGGSGGPVDQTFDPSSANAQSGVAIATELENYVEKVEGKGLSTNDYTDEEKQKNAKNATDIEGINTSLADYVKKTDYASFSKAGVAKVDPVGTRGISIDDSHFLTLLAASPSDIDARIGKRAIIPSTLNTAVKAALTDSNRITDMTPTEKENAREVIDAEPKTDITTYTGSALGISIPVQYNQLQICDTDITVLTIYAATSVPIGYECSFTFQSGATATMINYQGDSFKFVGVDCDADGDFVPSANTNYEVSIRNLSTDTANPLLVARVGVY